MKILAVDTATNSCSVAIIDEGWLLIEMTTVTNQTHSKRLMGIINTCLEMSGLTISNIDGFAVTIGPGSFTGLRLGLSVAILYRLENWYQCYERIRLRSSKTHHRDFKS